MLELLKGFIDEREEVIFVLLFIVGTIALFTGFTDDITYFGAMGANYGLLLGKKGADKWLITRGTKNEEAT